MPRARIPVLALVSLLGAAACNRPQAGTEKATLEHDGGERTYLYHVGTAAPASSRMLILSLHGRLGTGAQQEDMSGLSSLADERGFVVAYPDGVERSWADGRGASPADTRGVDDVGFLSALVAAMVASHAVDPARVFVTGMSNGAMMTNRLACERADEIAGIAPVAGTMPAAVAADCVPKRGVPALVFHGTEDGYVPYEGGTVDKGAGGAVLSAMDTAVFWAGAGGCDSTATETELADGTADDGMTAKSSSFGGCAGGGEVALITIDGGGHTWPASEHNPAKAIVGPTSPDVQASAMMVDFFESTPLP